MSIAYQCWEMGVGSTVGYKLGPQYVSESNNIGSSTLRCLKNHHHHHSLSPSSQHEASFANFAMYMQPPPTQSDLKGGQQQQPKDMPVASAAAKEMMAVRFASSPHISSPLSAAAATDVTPPKQAETNVTTSSVTTERSVDEKAGDGAIGGVCEAQSKRLEAGVPGTIFATGGLSGALLADRGLRAKVLSSRAKPGVVEHIVPINVGSAYGGYMYGGHNAQLEHSSESSSSICQASEDSGSCSSGDTGGEEAQSVYRGPLTTMMSSLDESLPIKRPGLSKFFGGKSRSFSSLAEVSSVTELAKPNNPYAKRRKMGFNCPLGDKGRSSLPPARSSGASIAKKLPSNGSRNTLAVAVILGGLQEEQQPAAAPSAMRNPEIRTFPSRSYSLTDLPHAGSPTPLRRSLGRP